MLRARQAVVAAATRQLQLHQLRQTATRTPRAETNRHSGVAHPTWASMREGMSFGRAMSSHSAGSAAASIASARVFEAAQPISSQQERWDRLRTTTASILTDTTNASQRVEWVHLPDVRAQPSSHRNLQHDTRVQQQPDGDDIDDDATLRAFLVSKQTISPSLHEDPLLLTPSVRALWRRLAAWDRTQQIQSMEQQRDDDVASPIGWSSRGLFLDGPNGVSKSTSLYSLACMARSQNWLVVHIADADEWVGQLAEGAATRMFVQAVYEACASTIRPETAAFSQPHSMLQMPLSPELDYTETLVEQGIHTFGDLLTLSLELSDGLEETELSVECIMDQLMNIQGVPVLICIDGFDALTQKSLQAPKQPDAEEGDEEDDLVAPITTSPFSWVNYHRAQPFRGGFVLSGESFALVQRSHPELMERISASEDIEEDDDVPSDAAARRRNRLQQQEVEPIHVYPLPALSPAMSKEYLLHRVSLDASLSNSFLFPSLDASYWSFLYHHVHSGHFSLLNSLLQLDAVSESSAPSPTALRESFVDATSRANLRAYRDYFGASADLRRNLAVFFARHLTQGFYKDFLRLNSRSDVRAANAAQIARDYNLIAVNEGESRSMVAWVRQQLATTANSNGDDRIIADSAPWQQLCAVVPWESLSKSELKLVQQVKVEALLQVIAMATIVKQSITCTRFDSDASARTHTLPVRAVSHWCSATDPPLLQAEDLELDSINCHWNMPPPVAGVSPTDAMDAAPYLTRLVHVGSGGGGRGDGRVLTMLLPNLDPALADLLFVAPTRPITPLMHTLYLHYLADILKGMQVCVGPAMQVRAHANDGSSYGWQDLDDLVESLQAGVFDVADELPLQHLSITHIRAHAGTIDGAQNEDRHTLRVCLLSPHAQATIPLKQQPQLVVAGAATSPSSASPSPSFLASSSPPLPLHPLFRFVDAIVGEDLARLLDTQTDEVQQIRWN